MTPSESLQTTIDGDLWWGGFTADLAISNTSNQDLDGWTISFVSPHQLDPNAWGVSLASESLGNGLTRYTLTGSDWGSRIPAGGTMRVGFNGTQGTDLGREGRLTEQMLIAEAGMTSGSSSTVDVNGSMAMDETSSGSMGGMSMAATEMLGHDSDQHSMSHHAPLGGTYTDITSWGSFHGSNHNSEHNELVGGRTAITTEAMEAYNGLRSFSGLEAVDIETVGEWAFANGLTNNSQAWGDDTKGVGLWYAMQGSKVGWIADEAYNPQILADIQRTARQGSADTVMAMVREFGHRGFADHLEQNGLKDAFINTLKMEPHYGGWMHGRTHGFLDIEGVAIAHDINHLTVLGWDQSQPFMNDTFDWPQWPALDVSDQTVINYYQGIVALGDPLAQNLEDLGGVAEQQPVAVAEQLPATARSAPIDTDPLIGTALEVEVDGDLWWGGFTAEITVINQSERQIDGWALSFTSNHRFYGESWGVDVTTEQLEGDLYRYELSGADWGESIAAGQSMTVGFNALAGTELERNGTLNEAMLLAADSQITQI